MQTLSFFQGFVTGALVAMLIIFTLMAVFTYRIKTGAEATRKTAEEHSLRSLELMKERNEQEKETQTQLCRIADTMEGIRRHG